MRRGSFRELPEARLTLRLCAGVLAAAVSIGWLTLAMRPMELGANGGTLRLNDVPVGPYRMAVFSDPTPFRPDSADVSVLMLDPESGEIVWGLEVTVAATDGATRLSNPATREQADDPDRYYSSKFVLPNPGLWTFTIAAVIDAGTPSEVRADASFEAEVKERGPLDNPILLTTLLLLPLLALALWMIKGNAKETAALIVLVASLVQVVSCRPPDRTPPYERLSELLVVEDQRSETLPDELTAATLEQSPAVRAAAYRALGRHERADWMDAIAAGLRDPDQEVRVVAVDAVAQSAFQDGPDLSASRAALDHFNAALGGERSPRVRAALALAAGRLGRDSVLADAAERIILEVSTEPGEAALFDPRSIGNPGAPLLDLVRGSFALARASRGTHPLRDELTVLLAELTAFGREGQASNSLDPAEPTLTAVRIRRTALATLLTTGRLSGPVVTQAARDADPGVRALLAGALNTRIEVPNADELMTRLADDPSPQVRNRWIAAYARADRPDGCAPLFEAVADPETGVSLTALDVLAAPCPAEERAEQMALLADVARRDHPDKDWHAAAHATAALARADATAGAAAAERLATHPNPFARAWAARALTVAGGGQTLSELSNDPDANVRAAAITGLIETTGGSAVPTVIEQLGSSAPQLVMVAANLLEGTPATEAMRVGLWDALSRFTAGGQETDRDARVALLVRLAEVGESSDSTRLAPYVEDYDPEIAARAASILSSWTGRQVAASPRPFSPSPPPSAEELARLDEAYVDLTMERGGVIRIGLLPLVAPTNAARFARLADSGVLDGLTFHRVVPGFVIQGGSPGANEYAGHGAFSRDEISDLGHWRGTVGTSTRGRDTGDGQLFVNLLDNLRLDNNYTIWGVVLAGMDVVDGVLEGDRIQSAQLVTQTP